MDFTIFESDFSGQVKGDAPLAEWLSEFRQDRFLKAKSTGLPTKKVESWKYTSLKKMGDFNLSIPSFDESSVLEEIPQGASHLYNEDEICLVFYDGFFQEALSVGMDSEVLVGSLASALKETGPLAEKLDREELKGWLSGLDDRSVSREDTTVFSNLNSALFKEGSIVYIKPKTQVKKQVRLINIYSEGYSCGRYSKNVVVVGDFSKASLIEAHVSLGENAGFTNCVSDLFIGLNASASYVRVQEEGLKSGHIGCVRAQLLKDARLNVFNLCLGGNFHRNDLHIYLEGEGASVGSHGLYLCKDKQHMDNRSAIYHMNPHTVSDQLYKGILADKARSVFNGKVYIAQDAQHVDSNQVNHNILIGDGAEADTKPELEVYADDVKATHGASVGQLDDTEVFYLQSRGISELDAKAMIARGFVGDAILKIEDKRLRGFVNTLVDNRFIDFSAKVEDRLGSENSGWD